MSIRKLTHDPHPICDNILNLCQYEINNVEWLVCEDVKEQKLLKTCEALWVAAPGQ